MPFFVSFLTKSPQRFVGESTIYDCNRLFFFFCPIYQLFGEDVQLLYLIANLFGLVFRLKLFACNDDVADEELHHLFFAAYLLDFFVTDLPITFFAFEIVEFIVFYNFVHLSEQAVGRIDIKQITVLRQTFKGIQQSDKVPFIKSFFYSCF